MKEDLEPSKETSPEAWLIGIALALSLVSGLYRLLVAKRLESTAALFLGIPAVLAVLLAMTPKAKTVTGGIIKAITLMLLIVAPLLGEGWFCILMASPLFYLVGLLVGLLVDRSRRRRGATLSCVALFLLPISLEGVVPGWTVEREQTVEVTRVVDAPATAVERALARRPRVGPGRQSLPLLLRIGFPVPLESHGWGLEPGALRTVRFSGVEGAPAGDLVMRVTEGRPGLLQTEAVSDGSKLAHWLRWERSEVEWRALDPTHTRVTWRIEYRRQLDPAWYFGPWERAAVHEAAVYMIRANATPAEAAQ